MPIYSEDWERKFAEGFELVQNLHNYSEHKVSYGEHLARLRDNFGEDNFLIAPPANKEGVPDASLPNANNSIGVYRRKEPRHYEPDPEIARRLHDEKTISAGKLHSYLRLATHEADEIAKKAVENGIDGPLLEDIKHHSETMSRIRDLWHGSMEATDELAKQDEGNLVT